MSSLPLGGVFMKFATKNHRTASVEWPEAGVLLRLNHLFDAPQNTHSCIPVNADIVEPILYVGFGHVHRAPLWIGAINLKQ